MKFNPTRQDIRTYLVDASDRFNGRTAKMISGTEKLESRSPESPAGVRGLCHGHAFRRALSTNPDWMVIAEVWEIDEERPEMKLSYSTAERGIKSGTPLSDSRS